MEIKVGRRYETRGGRYVVEVGSIIAKSDEKRPVRGKVVQVNSKGMAAMLDFKLSFSLDGRDSRHHPNSWDLVKEVYTQPDYGLEPE